MDSVNVELFGKDPRVVKAISVARNISVTKAAVLIVGENGVGKRTLGYYIHQNSNRVSKPFEVVDCALSHEDVERKILGFREESGRFVKGAFEAANGGTVIFANIDSLDETFQKRVCQIMSELADYDIDVRILATTTKNLAKLVGAGRFSRQLYTLVSQTQIALPALREREGDLESLAKYYAEYFSGSPVSFEQSAINKILEHYWSYNIEELKRVMQASMEEFKGQIFTDNDLFIGERKSSNIASEEESTGISLMSLHEAEKLLIKKALVHTSENRTQAAKILGVSIRTLRNKINEYRNEGNSYFMNLR